MRGVDFPVDSPDPEDPRVVGPSTANATASLGQALSASVIATLVDVHSYEADDTTGGVSRDGQILPANSKKKQFPRGMKRLRDRLQILDDRLRMDVMALKQQILDLQLHRTLMSTKIKAQQPQMHQTITDRREQAVEIVVEYFRAFQFGWIQPVGFGGGDRVGQRADRSASGRTAIQGQQVVDYEETKFPVGSQREEEPRPPNQRQDMVLDRQHRFIATAVNPSIQASSREDGVTALVQHWQRFSTHHENNRLELTSMSCHGSIHETIVVALGSWSGWMAPTQIQELYPAVLKDPSLVERLVGIQIQYPSREVFHFDAEGHVILYDVDLDVVAALQRVIGSLRDVECLLGTQTTRSRGKT